MVIGIGLALVAVGAVLWLLERAGVRPGHLPGDISGGNGNVRVYFPIGTSILLSVILTLLLWLVNTVRR